MKHDGEGMPRREWPAFDSGLRRNGVLGLRPGGHRVEAPRQALQLRTLPALEEGQKSELRPAMTLGMGSGEGAVRQVAVRPRALDERLAGLLAARRGDGLATAPRSDSMLRRSASMRLITFWDEG